MSPVVNCKPCYSHTFCLLLSPLSLKGRGSWLITLSVVCGWGRFDDWHNPLVILVSAERDGIESRHRHIYIYISGPSNRQCITILTQSIAIVYDNERLVVDNVWYQRRFNARQPSHQLSTTWFKHSTQHPLPVDPPPHRTEPRHHIILIIIINSLHRKGIISITSIRRTKTSNL